MSVEQMRDKLRIINQYLRSKLGPDVVPAPQKKSVAKEIVSEQAADQMILDTDMPESIEPQEITTTVALPGGHESPENKTKERLGVGLDLGTAYLVASREIEGTRVFVKIERNAFLSVRADEATKAFLLELRIKYASLGNNVFVLGTWPTSSPISLTARSSAR